MKSVYIITMLVTAMFMLTLPLCAKNSLNNLPVSALPLTETEQTVSSETVKLKLSQTGEIITISAEDYIFGVVAAEMPALYENEALKAQAVAAYTYYINKKEAYAAEEFDITDDYTQDQSFITALAAREKWGSGADEYENKIRSAVKSVLGKRVLYNGAPANTVYHAISFGVTENCAEVWGSELAYLTTVDSSWDKLEKNYLSEKVVTAAELQQALAQVTTIQNLNENCITDIVRTQAGTVKTLNVAGVSISGADFRKLLSLRSANFEVAFSSGSYTFTTKGYGHSLGMSQYGAHYLAMQGKSYKEILQHYYKGCEVE